MFFMPEYRCATCGETLSRLDTPPPLPLDGRMTVVCTRCEVRLLVPVQTHEALVVSRREVEA